MVKEKIYNILGIKHKEIENNSENDIKAINTFLENVNEDINELQEISKELEELKEEENVIEDKNVEKENMRKQIKKFDKLLTKYEHFKSDADINAIRIKDLTETYLQKAEEKGLHSLKDKMKKRWDLTW